MGSLSEIEVRDQICVVGQRLHRKNFLAACDGNISYRLADDCILITPTGVSKGYLTADQIAVIKISGEVVRGRPSGETKMHLQVYRSSKKAKAVVHAHPPHAIAWSVARPDLAELPANSLSEVILATGRIPFVPYARPGTQQMGDRLTEFLPHCRAMILSRHGALAWGESLEEAANGMERIDHSAQILFLAHQMGQLTELPAEEVKHLQEMRKNIGEKLL